MWITEYWDLIQILTVSDLRVKYQSSLLGFAWSLVNPLLMMLVLYVVFSNIFHMSENQFALYILIGIVSWRFLQNGSSAAMSSIVGKPGLVTKIYIPRQILVLSSVLSSFISSILEFLVLFCLLLAFGVSLSFTILLFPLVHIVFLVLLFGLSLGLASLYVYYRDLNQIWEVILQAGFFLCPIVYPLSSIPEKYLPYYMLNPITDFIEIYRDILLYGQLPSPKMIAIVVVFGLILFIIGRLLFGKLERRFAEEV